MIEASFAGQEERCLHKALSERHNLLVKYLAYQDLSSLAEHGQDRRAQVFALSQPGERDSNNNNSYLARCTLRLPYVQFIYPLLIKLYINHSWNHLSSLGEYTAQVVGSALYLPNWNLLNLSWLDSTHKSANLLCSGVLRQLILLTHTHTPKLVNTGKRGPPIVPLLFIL